MKISQKIAGYAFLISNAIPLLLAVCLTIRKTGIKHRMRENLHTQTLQTVIIPSEKVIWMDDHEIWVNESMFDIHSKTEANGMITFTGLYDEDETLLVKQQQNQGDHSMDKKKNLLRLFKCMQQYHSVPQPLYSSGAGFLSLEFASSSPGEVQQHYDVITPPPRVLLLS